jgi:hypothetical protein
MFTEFNPADVAAFINTDRRGTPISSSTAVLFLLFRCTLAWTPSNNFSGNPDADDSLMHLHVAAWICQTLYRAVAAFAVLSALCSHRQCSVASQCLLGTSNRFKVVRPSAVSKYSVLYRTPCTCLICFHEMHLAESAATLARRSTKHYANANALRKHPCGGWMPCPHITHSVACN